MKRSTFAILFTVLITLSCVFASCNARDTIPLFDSSDTTDTDTEAYTSMIRELEDQIVELKQNQYISESKRAEEILRLEKLILEIKQSANTNTDNDTEQNTDTDTNKDTSADTDTDASTEPDNTDNAPTGKFLYTVNENKATVTGYTGGDTVLTIPSSIDGYEVTAIADDAFTSKELETVIVPDGVTKIGWFAFAECDALRSVTLPDSVVSIGYSAFPKKINGFTLICSSESFASRYAESYGLSVTSI
ncbi:MAG: leucine-rich repeat protein [Clostridia bacterium]|nr:leucine-rich repeat protein [Clostridia bacterium]